MSIENTGFIIIIILLIALGAGIGWFGGTVYRPDGVGKLLNAFIGITGVFFGLTVGMLFFDLERPFTLPIMSTFFFAIAGGIAAILLVNWLRHLQHSRR